MTERPRNEPGERLPLRARLALHEIDGVTLLIVPAVLFVIGLFVYPFIYGFILSFQPKAGGGSQLPGFLRRFCTTPSPPRSGSPFSHADQCAISVDRPLRAPDDRRRILTTILVIPITLGTVLIAGACSVLGPQGWFNRTLMLFGFGGSGWFTTTA